MARCHRSSPSNRHQPRKDCLLLLPYLCGIPNHSSALLVEFFPRVRTPCGHGAQVIIEEKENNQMVEKRTKTNMVMIFFASLRLEYVVLFFFISSSFCLSFFYHYFCIIIYIMDLVFILFSFCAYRWNPISPFLSRAFKNSCLHLMLMLPKHTTSCFSSRRARKVL